MMPTLINIINDLRSDPGAITNPCYMEVSLVGGCNFACVQCHQLHHIEIDKVAYKVGGAKRLEIKRALLLLDEAKAMGVETVEFCGRGEPTLFPGLADLIRRTKALGFRGCLITNGSRLTASVSEAMAESGFDEVSVSLYGATEETFHHITRARDGHSLESIIANIKYLKSVAPGTKLTVLFLLQTSMLEDLGEVLGLMETLPADRFKFVVSLPYQDKVMQSAASSEKLSAEFAAALGNHYERLAADQSRVIPKEFTDFIRFYLSTPETDTIKTTYSKIPCYAGRWAVFVCDDGTVRPCSNSSWILGDLYQSSLRDIWLGQNYGAFREAAATHIMRTRTPIHQSYCGHCGWARLQSQIHAALHAPEFRDDALFDEPY
jgi:MoaA/NifB/PqqE/SkfB family radical SAM enzyme